MLDFLSVPQYPEVACKKNVVQSGSIALRIWSGVFYGIHHSTVQAATVVTCFNKAPIIVALPAARTVFRDDVFCITPESSCQNCTEYHGQHNEPENV